ERPSPHRAEPAPAMSGSFGRGTPPLGAPAHAPALPAAEAPARTRLPGGLRSLAYPGYRAYWFAAAISFTCWVTQNTARGWLTLELTNSPWLVGVVVGIGSLPLLLFSVWGGVLADRFNRKRLVMINESFIAVSSATLV